MSVSGEVAAPPTVQVPAQPELPEGFVAVKQTDHDAQAGDLRRIRKENAALKQAKEDRDLADQAEAAKAAGDFDTALGVERDARKAADKRTSKALLGDAITDVLLARNYTGEQATAIKRMVDRDTVELSGGEPVAASVTAAVDAVVEQFPNLFNTEAPTPENAERPARRAGPATPPPGAQDGKPEGYVSPEEYQATPMATRYTDAFRARVEVSRPFWPKVIHRADLQQDTS
jgi:hypothetical protein